MNIKVELWELTGAYWRMPLRVVWYAELAEVRVGAGAPLTEKMRAVAEEKLLTVATRKGTNFWASKEVLGRIAVPSRYEDPQEVIEWAPLRPAAKVSAGTFQASEFIQNYCECSYAVIRNPLMATAVWSSFCKFMMHWMLNERGTVDLIFAEMNAFAFRKNWMGVAAKMEHQMWRQGQIKDRDLFNPDPQNIADRMCEILLHRNLTAFNEKAATLEYTIDVRPNKKWRDFVVVLNQARRERLASFYGIIRELRLQLRRVIRAYGQYLEEAVHPITNVACFVYDRAAGKWTWDAGSRTAGASGDPRDGGAALSTPLESRAKETVHRTAETLPAPVPDLQSPDPDLRDAGTESLS